MRDAKTKPNPLSAKRLHMLLVVLLALVCSCVARVSIAKEPSLSEVDEALSRDSRGFRNGAFEADFLFLGKRFPQGKDPLAIDAHLLIAAQRIIVQRQQGLQASGRTVPSSHGRHFPVEMFSALRAALDRTFQLRLGLQADIAGVLATEIEREALSLAGVKYKEYERAVERVSPLNKENVRDLVKTAVDELYKSSTILDGCDIPFFGGYSTEKPDVVYIDRIVSRNKRLGGVNVPVQHLLNVHERVEKAILDEFSTTYFNSHQIALRLEKLAAGAYGVPWKPYDAYWTRLVPVMDEKPIKAVPRDLDLSPYLSFKDESSVETVSLMRGAYVDPDRCRKSGRPY